MSLVVDASVVVKWFVAEARSDAARSVLGSGERLLAPDLVVPEVCNAVWKKLRRGEVTPEQAAAAASGVHAVLDQTVPTAGLAARALDLARRGNHPVYDCFYLALAEVVGCDVVSDDACLEELPRTLNLEIRVRPLAPRG